MRKCWKKLILFALILFVTVVVGKGNLKAATIIDSGSCGENATYTLDSDGLLTISGSGKINDYAFTGAEWARYEKVENIKKVVIEKGITNIGRDTFEFCYNLKSVSIPEGVTEIDNDAFSACSSLTSIIIPEGVKKIDEWTFYECSSLTSVTMPESVTWIGDEAFAGCESLTSIIIPESVTWIGQNAFGGCRSLASITIPKGVTEIGMSMFVSCESLTSITIPEGVTEIGDAAFWNCKNLTSVTMPESVTKIGNDAFAKCNSLKSITIPKGVKEIDGWAFHDCGGLTSITILNESVVINTEALYEANENCIIYGYTGSTAEEFALEHNRVFKTINSADTASKTKLTTKNTTIKLSKTSYTYDGKAKKPTVKVLNSKGKVLKSSNYTVKYSNNVKAGKATVTIKFKGKYTGIIKATYTIKPKTTAITGATRNGSKVALIWKKQATQTSGYQIQYATDKKFTKDKQLVTVSGAKKTSMTIKNVPEDKSYYFRIRTYKTVNGKKVYSAWSKVKKVKTE